MLKKLVLIAMAGMLAFCAAPAMAAGIPVSDGGVVRVVPLGNDADGDRASPFYSSTLTADLAICGAPASPDDPLDYLKLIASNVRAEMLLYPGQNAGDTDLNATGGLSLLLEANGAIPAKIGGTWAPYTEWDAAWYAGLNFIKLATPEEPLPFRLGGTRVDVTRLTLGPQYGSGGSLGFGFELTGTF